MFLFSSPRNLGKIPILTTFDDFSNELVSTTKPNRFLHVRFNPNVHVNVTDSHLTGSVARGIHPHPGAFWTSHALVGASLSVAKLVKRLRWVGDMVDSYGWKSENMELFTPKSSIWIGVFYYKPIHFEVPVFGWILQCYSLRCWVLKNCILVIKRTPLVNGCFLVEKDGGLSNFRVEFMNSMTQYANGWLKISHKGRATWPWSWEMLLKGW